ncbi:MAG: hypothetical protein ACR2KN_00510, partial [Geodermatophilaceae bacterium]
MQPALQVWTESLRPAADQERAARRRDEARRVARARGSEIAEAVAGTAQSALLRIAESVQQAGDDRDRIAQERVGRDADLLA